MAENGAAKNGDKKTFWELLAANEGRMLSKLISWGLGAVLACALVYFFETEYSKTAELMREQIKGTSQAEDTRNRQMERIASAMEEVSENTNEVKNFIKQVNADHRSHKDTLDSACTKLDDILKKTGTGG